MTTDPAMKPQATIEWNETQYRILLTRGESDGRVGMWESVCPPNEGPPRHIHQHEDEIFYVIAGEMLFWRAGTTVSRKSGEICRIRRGTEHTFTIAGPSPARFVVCVTPGGFEGFFPDVAARGLRIPQDLSDVAALAAQYGMTVTGPPIRL